MESSVATQQNCNLSGILPNFSFEESDDVAINFSNICSAEGIEVEEQNTEKIRKKHNWTTEACYQDLDEALGHIQCEGFNLHKINDLNCGVKMYFRCKNVPFDRRPWCDFQYVLFLPAESVDCVVQHNNLQHNCHELMIGVKKRMSCEMQDFIFGIFEKGTQRIGSVLAHVREEMSKNSRFVRESVPGKRQIEYLLGKYRNNKVEPLFKLGDLMEWCDSNSVFPQDPDKEFVLNHECSMPDEVMNFRLIISTPELLRKAIKFETVCIDATYKLNWHGFPLIVFGTVDRQKRFHPVAYACCTHETTADYEFVFKAIRNAIKVYYEQEFEPKILIADGADAIRNAFYNACPSAEIDIMCFAHVIRNIRKRSFSSKSNKQLVLDDIRKIQLAANKSTFSMMTALFCQKWTHSEPEFIEYFKKEWMGSHCNWFEGAANYTPSTNNALESHNAVIKRSITLRKRLPLNQFLTCISKLINEISREFSSGERTIEIRPKVDKNLMQKAALMEQEKCKAFRAKSNKPTYMYSSIGKLPT